MQDRNETVDHDMDLMARRRLDRILAQARFFPWPVRAMAARAAARRGMGAAALAAAPLDPGVLLDLGLYASATAATNPAARIIGLAGLGRIEDARRLLEQTPDFGAVMRTRLAQVAAASDPSWSLDLLGPEAFAARAACELALGRPAKAQALIRRAATSRETRLVAAAAHAASGRYVEARAGVNALFATDGLEPPLAPIDRPLSLEAFDVETPRLEGERPLVSVIVAAKDAASTIEIAIQSLQRQSWPRLEILVVDDGSSDDTATRVRNRMKADDRVRLLSNTRTPGAYGARNTGAQQATGQFIAFHDADDWAHPRRIERQVAELAQAAGAVCSYFRVSEIGEIVNPRVYPLLRRNPILMMLRRDAALRIGPMDEVRLGADSEYLARLDDRLGRWAVTRMPACLVVAGWSGGSLMGAASTGLSPEGLARRVAYVEDWRRRHAGLA